MGLQFGFIQDVLDAVDCGCLNMLGQVWRTMDGFGQVWTRLDKFGYVCVSLLGLTDRVCFGKVYISLDMFEELLNFFESFENIWISFGSFESFCKVLKGIARFCKVLKGTARF